MSVKYDRELLMFQRYANVSCLFCSRCKADTCYPVT